MSLSLESLLGKAVWLLADMRDHLAKQSEWDGQANYLVDSCNDFFLEGFSLVKGLIEAEKPGAESTSAPNAEKPGLGWKSPHRDEAPGTNGMDFPDIAPSTDSEASIPVALTFQFPDFLPKSSSTSLMPPKKDSIFRTYDVDFF